MREHTDLDTRVSADRLRGLFGKTMTEISGALFPTLSEAEQAKVMDACRETEIPFILAEYGFGDVPDAFAAAGCSPRRPGAGDLLLAVDDALIAAQNAVTAAESLGIGSYIQPSRCAGFPG